MSEKLPCVEDVWYRDGLRFTCTGCGRCCSGSPGYVWVTVDEIISLAKLLDLSVDQFSARYVRVVNGRYALRERPGTAAEDVDCVFLENKKCLVYTDRPKQCKTYPWWKQHLTSPEAWQKEAQFCEGINHPDAPVISAHEIKKVSEQ